MSTTTKPANERQLLREADYHRQCAEHFQTLKTFVFEIVANEYGIEQPTHSADIAANVACLAPELPSQVSLMVSLNQHDEAKALIREAVNALKEHDQPLFEIYLCRPEDKVRLRKLWNHFTSLSVATAAANRAGVDEGRADAYRLAHKRDAEQRGDHANVDGPIRSSGVVNGYAARHAAPVDDGDGDKPKNAFRLNFGGGRR